MDEARALAHALCSSSVSCVSLLCSMSECFNVLVGCSHARGMWLGMRLVYAACAVAFVAGVTGAGCYCLKSLYAQTHNTLVRYEIIIFYCKQPATITLIYTQGMKQKA